jgi:hypothetical protein
MASPAAADYRADTDRLFNASRSARLDDALADLGAFATGRSGFIVYRGQSLRAVDALLPTISLNGSPAQAEAVVVADRALRALGLEWVRVGQGQPPTRRAAVGTLIFRAGLLARILDRSFHHLETRESGGQKTLQHQLVKACFVECLNLSEQIRLEAMFLLEESSHVDFALFHNLLTDATMKAAKLMGGHGFLLGEANSIEFLSLCMSSICSCARQDAVDVDQSLVVRRELQQCVA